MHSNPRRFDVLHREMRNAVARALLWGLFALASMAAQAQPSESRNLAPGFSALPKGTKVAVMPLDIELYSISAGGVREPKADWTEQAHKNFRGALLERQGIQGIEIVTLSERDADDVADINALHGAVARAISLHHFGVSSFRLPTKDGKLDWSLGEVVRAVKGKTGADYALFSWVRDSYASGARMATIAAMVLLGGGGSGGGVQVGYASLVDLNTGRVLWFNRLIRNSGDLREPSAAAETVEALLDQFPVTK
jgi:hypothetical protein